MVFSSIIFLFMFLPLFLTFYFLAKKIKTKNNILLIFSLFFYAFGEPYYVFLMLFIIVLNYFLTIIMDKKKSKIIFIFIIFIDLLSLFSFKYLNFFIHNINNLFGFNIKTLNLVLPIGISFYIFQILSYVIDVYKGKVVVQKSFINLACYVSAFPQLIAGPIVRYSDIERELNKRSTTFDDFYVGCKRFIYGLSKKVLIANNVSFICDRIFSFDIVSAGFIGVVIAILSYTFQIYFDFSGYSDMAIGLGRICGFHYSENFNMPYLASSVTDFWRRWHISLSSWFRDYVYIPLGGNRVSKIKFIRNVLIVWLLTGLWHGDSWNFVLWGLYFGVILLIEKFFFKSKEGIFSHIITMFIVCIGWLLFRAESISLLFSSFKALFFRYGFGDIASLNYLGIFSFRYVLAFIAGVVFSFNIIKIKDGMLKDVLTLLLFVLSILYIVVNSYNPFIYFRF